MRTILVAFVVCASLLLAMQPAAAITPPSITINEELQSIEGFGVLDSVPRQTIVLIAAHVEVAIGSNPPTIQEFGSLTLGGGAPESCTIDTVAEGCHSASIICDISGPHTVTEGVQGVSSGFFDGTAVKVGFINMACGTRTIVFPPPASRSR